MCGKSVSTQSLLLTPNGNKLGNDRGTTANNPAVSVPVYVLYATSGTSNSNYTHLSLEIHVDDDDVCVAVGVR